MEVKITHNQYNILNELKKNKSIVRKSYPSINGVVRSLKKLREKGIISFKYFYIHKEGGGRTINSIYELEPIDLKIRDFTVKKITKNYVIIEIK